MKLSPRDLINPSNPALKNTHKQCFRNSHHADYIHESRSWQVFSRWNYLETVLLWRMILQPRHVIGPCHPAQQRYAERQMSVIIVSWQHMLARFKNVCSFLSDSGSNPLSPMNFRKIKIVCSLGATGFLLWMQACPSDINRKEQNTFGSPSHSHFEIMPVYQINHRKQNAVGSTVSHLESKPTEKRDEMYHAVARSHWKC